MLKVGFLRQRAARREGMNHTSDSHDHPDNTADHPNGPDNQEPKSVPVSARMTHRDIWEKHKALHAGSASLAAEEGAHHRFLETLDKTMDDPVDGDFGIQFSDLLEKHRERRLSDPAIKSKTVLGPEQSRLRKIAKTCLIMSLGQDLPAEFCACFRELLRRDDRSATDCAKGIFAKHPELGNPTARTRCMRYQRITMTMSSWLKATPDVRSDLKMLAALEEELNVPGILQARLPHIAHARDYDPEFAEKDPIDGLPLDLGLRIRHFRHGKGWSIARLEKALGIGQRLGRVEIGLARIPQFRRDLIEEIDRALDADGAVLRLFDRTLPDYHNEFAAQCAHSNRLKYGFWNAQLEEEFCGLERYKRDIARPAPKKGKNRWSSDGTADLMRELLSNYMGYLRLPVDGSEAELCGCDMDEVDLSIALIADTRLVMGFLNFLKLRAGGGAYTARTESICRAFRSLVCRDFGYIRQHPEFAEQPHFAGKLPTSLKIKYNDVKVVTVPLDTIGERWSGLCDEAMIWFDNLANNLHRSTSDAEVVKGNFANGRVDDILNEDAPYDLLLAAGKRLDRVPYPRSTQPYRWATYVRDRLIFAILAHDPFRPSAIIEFRLEDFRQTKEGVWYGRSDEAKAMKNGRKPKGPLHAGIQALFTLYVQEARPILVAGKKRSPFLFVSRNGKSGTLRMTTGVLYRNLVGVAKRHLRHRSHSCRRAGFGPLTLEERRTHSRCREKQRSRT